MYVYGFVVGRRFYFLDVELIGLIQAFVECEKNVLCVSRARKLYLCTVYWDSAASSVAQEKSRRQNRREGTT